MQIPYKPFTAWNDEFRLWLEAQRNKPNFCAANSIRDWCNIGPFASRLTDNEYSLLIGLAMACEFIGHRTYFDSSHQPLNETSTQESKVA